MNNLRIYDNGGKTFDRFTVVFMDRPERNGLYEALAMSEGCYHPQGIGMHTSAMPGRHLGKRIGLDSLPSDCRKFVSVQCEV